MGAATQTDRKTLMVELYEAYISCPWAWSSVQAIARTITAGGLVTEWQSDDGEGDQQVPDKPDNVLALEALLAFCNPQQNIRQLCRNFIADLLVFADAYIEVVWVGNRPVALYNQDSPTTTPVADEHGNITKYVQVTDYGKKVEFEPREIIHVSLDSARPGIVAVSPMQAALGPITAWLFAQATGKETFKKGLPPEIHVDFPAATQETDIRKWRDQHMTRNVGAKNIGTPITTKGGAGVKELQASRIDAVFKGKDQARDEILSIFGVPPAEAGVIESGNLGGGTGDSQHRTFQINTCGPISELVAEAFSYSLAVVAFGITDWMLRFGEVDYRDSKVVEDIRDTRLRNGAWTLNKYRQEIGEPPVDGGDEAVLIDRQNLVLWADLAEMSKANIAYKNKGTAQPGQPGQPGAPGPGQRDGQPEPAEPVQPGDEPAPDGKPTETLRRGQVAAYRARLAEALRHMPRVTEADSKPLADEVWDQLSATFPAEAIAWVKDADWSGPHWVPVEHVDDSNRDSWAASRDDGRVAKLRKKLRKRLADGKHPKPVVLVRTPGADKDIIVDGHHHFLATEAEGHPTVWSYVGRVSQDEGPWDEMHSSQRGG
jgi:HK97 family phage portal protein